jgi:hypothetical protein
MEILLIIGFLLYLLLLFALLAINRSIRKTNKILMEIRDPKIKPASPFIIPPPTKKPNDTYLHTP